MIPMRTTLLFLLSALLLFTLTACSVRSSQPQEQSQATHNPTPEEILKNNPNADMLLLRDIVYTNAEDIEWVQQENIGSLQKVGEIGSIYPGSGPFENEMSTKLAPGTPIFESAGSGLILVVKVDGKEIRYLGLVEG